ncbi:MAG TPA: methionyl-tRNA formyltransferase [Saprospiraceae bacterium]|nr:methionyl-tRNA formyltransferase [Saprospiraceae bacterium]
MVDRNLRIIFMGTPEFALASLEILLDAGYLIVGVVTAPDKTGGRGLQQKIISPVKSFALEKGLKVLQPANLKSKEFINELRSLKADLQIVVAFRMLPRVDWNMPPKGTMNLHGSLLPAYRGAAPIQWAIINGETKTGVTTFLLQHEIDSGNLIAKREIPILEKDDAGTLHDRMMHAGAGLVLGSVDLIASGNIKEEPQDNSKISHAPKIHHEDGHIDWSKPVDVVYNLIRAMSPFPGAWTKLDEKDLKIFKAKKYSDQHNHPQGTITVNDRKIIVQAIDGELELTELQLAGKKRMTASDFLNGYKIKDWRAT